MKVESIAECSLGAFCNTFDLHLAKLGLKKKIVFILSGRLRQVLLYLFTGTLNIYEMMNLAYDRIDEIQFTALTIRNKGTVNMNNKEYQHQLTGTIIEILPGGLFTAKNLRVDVDTLIIDVMAEMNANDNGYCDMGK